MSIILSLLGRIAMAWQIQRRLRAAEERGFAAGWDARERADEQHRSIHRARHESHSNTEEWERHYE